jgi:phthiocerol/phenolphthiocerol synthesis type-I polyketide synthase E
MADENQTDEHFEGLGIAVIGMAGRFPGAENVDEFWRNLCAGVESVTYFSDEELRQAGVPEAELAEAHYVKAAPVLKDIELFDAGFFGYTPLEARLMDPQQRLLLEVAWEALENAGHAPQAGASEEGPIAVFTGARMSTYLFYLLGQRAALQPQDRLLVEIGNDVSSLATRLSYRLDLRGPSYMVQTACSTSLAAVHLACQSLLLGECKMALAGASVVMVPHRVGYHHEPGSMLSPDGHCRPFDAGAGGTVFGSGVGMVVLKRLADAQADGERILAVVRGSAVNNDGAYKASFTAPSVEGQTEVILEALACAGVDADTVSYLEAHGTGTPLGDPIEILALTNAYRASTDRRGFCQLGTVKGNLGHLDAAAGMAGFIKTVLALGHRQLPPSLHFTKPNPQIDFPASPFVVNTQLRPWTGPAPLRAGVSAFGFGGTNTHVILEEAPPAEPSTKSERPWQLLVWSARSAAALEAATADLAAWLRQHLETPLADVAFTLQVGRRDFDHRRVLVCRSTEEAAAALEARASERLLTGVRKSGEPPVAFLFPGQGAQHANMARELYETEPVFREEVDRALAALRPHLGFDLGPLLFPAPSGVEEANRRLTETALTQPALFVIEYALARLWMSWGLKPEAMIGHSIGEYVAACLAGVFSLEDALGLVAARGRLMQGLPAGGMLSVPLSEAEVVPLLASYGGRLALAAVNGPALCVVAGPLEAVAALEERLAAGDVPARRLHTSHAFHSQMMEPIVEEFAGLVRRVKRSAPQIPYVSNVTGTWITAEEATDPRYWARHLREAVRFGRGVETLLATPGRILLEVGPGQTLGTLARQQPAAADHLVLATLRHPQRQEMSDAAQILLSLGRMWLAGAPVAWKALHARERRCRVPLPTYPFERQRYWVDAVAPVHALQGGQAANLMATLSDWVHRRQALSDWFYLPGWKQSLLPRAGAVAPRRWLMLGDQEGLGARLGQRLEAEGHEVILVTPKAAPGAKPGEGLSWTSTRACSIDPRRREDYAALFAELEASGRAPQAIVHLWSLLPEEPEEGARADARFLEECQALGFDSLLLLAQALGERPSADPLELCVVTTAVQEVESGDGVCPERALVLGPCRVIPREYPHITCRAIDVAWPATRPAEAEQVVAQLAGELAVARTGTAADAVVAWRGRNRWVQALEPVRLEMPPGMADKNDRLRPRGRYLITGGLGGIGLVLAEFLARTVQARLMLIGRTGVPAAEMWDEWLATHDPADPMSVRIRKLRELRAAGAEVEVMRADVANPAEMAGVLGRMRDHWGGIDGVIHAAGVAGGGLIQLKTPEAADAVFGPKVRGARVLDALLGDTPLDFLVLFSSITAFVGEMGQVDYCAANAFLDVLARKWASRGRPAVAINWDMWHGAGMALDSGSQLPPALQAWREVQQQLAIRGEEGTEALGRVLAGCTAPQIIVSTTNLPELLEQFRALAHSNLLAELGQPGGEAGARPRPALANEYVAPRSEVERKVAEVWQKLLGVEQVGVTDSFFDLGGHSLLAAQLRNHLYKVFKVDLPLRTLFDTPTVAGVAGLIEKELGQDGGSERAGHKDQRPIAERLRAAFPTERQGIFEDYLRGRIAKVLHLEPGQLPADGRLTGPGIDLQLLGAELEYDLKQDFKFQLFPHEVRGPSAASVAGLARYLLTEMDRLKNLPSLATDRPLLEVLLRPYRKAAGLDAARPVRRPEKNPRMAFVHSSPRAGSTLFRVMLAGHPQLFCPPELNLLFFETMQEWHKNVGFGHEMEWTEGGLKWALMELEGLESAAGQARIDRLVADQASVQDVYLKLQQLAAPRLLVDKTPPYGLDPETLWRAEELFDQPKYIYLFRHPYPVMESILRLRMDRLFGPSLFGDADVDPYVVAETVWALSNRNLIEFCDRVGRERCLWVRYEDLVQDPRAAMTRVCEFLELPFDERVLEPYDGKRERMMGGLGDPNILQHSRIEPGLGEAWKKIQWPRALDASTLALMTRLGYAVAEMGESKAPAPPRSQTPAPPASAKEAERLLANLDQLSDEQVAALLEQMSAKG